MINLISHIEYLIQQHDCVIVAGLGGFVLNRHSAEIQQDGSVLPPTAKIGFNVDLTFNDGLLAESFMRVNGITYNQAVEQIDQIVKEIISNLNQNQIVSLGTLGELRKESGLLIFKSDKTSLHHPDVWGYSMLKLRCIESDQEKRYTVANNKRKPLFSRTKYAWGGIAALLGGLLLYSSFNTTALKKVQLSGFYLSSHASSEVALKITDSSITENSILFLDKVIEQKKKNAVKTEQYLENNRAIVENKISTPIFEKRYFIILGGDTEKSKAEKLLRKFKQKGFVQAAMVETSGRYRIYNMSFSNKDKANAYLNKFRKNNPEFSEAWLYTKRVQIN